MADEGPPPDGPGDDDLPGEDPPPHRRERRRKGQTRTMRLELRARWVIEQRLARPNTSVAKLIEMVVEKFECGHKQAKDAIANADAILAAQWKEGDPAEAEMVAHQLRELALDAARSKKHNAARLCWESYAKIKGLGVPDRMQIIPAGSEVEAMAEMTSDEIAAAARFEKILEEKRRAGLFASSEEQN